MTDFDTRAYEVDDVCRIIKIGRQTGKLCKVLDPFWLKTRVKVQMEKTGAIKSYLPSELNLVRAASDASRPDNCKLRPYDSVRVTKKSSYGDVGIIYSINKSGLCKVRMIAGGYRDFGDYDLEKISESQELDDVYSKILKEYMETGGSLGYKVCDRSIGSLLGDLGVFTSGHREVTAQAISNVVAYEIDVEKLNLYLQKDPSTLKNTFGAYDNIDENAMGGEAPLNFTKASNHPKLPMCWVKENIVSDFALDFDTVRTKSAALIATRLSLPTMPSVSISIDKCLQGSKVSILKSEDEKSVLKEKIDCFAIIVSGKLIKTDNIKEAQTHDLRYFFGTPSDPIYLEIASNGNVPARILKISGILNMRAEAEREEDALKKKKKKKGVEEGKKEE
jgi:hypothetical protein